MTVVLGLCLPVDANTAHLTFISIDLKPDASREPPGDSVEVRFFAETPVPVKIVAQPYLVSGPENEIVATVESSDPQLAIAGALSVSHMGQATKGINSIHVTIPYAAFGLETGTYRLGYEVRCYVANELQFAVGTKLSELSIDNGVRRLPEAQVMPDIDSDEDSRRVAPVKVFLPADNQQLMLQEVEPVLGCSHAPWIFGNCS